MRSYLAHSSHEQKQGKEIEARLTGMGIDVYNPFDKENEKYAELHAIIKNEGGFKLTDEEIGDRMTPEFATWIVDVDLEEIRKSDIVIYIIPEPEFHSVGGVCEMFWASRILNMPVFAYAPPHLVHHPWIIDHCEVICATLEDLYSFLEWFMGESE